MYMYVPYNVYIYVCVHIIVKDVWGTVEHNAFLTPKPWSACQSETLPQQKWSWPESSKNICNKFMNRKNKTEI